MARLLVLAAAALATPSPAPAPSHLAWRRAGLEAAYSDPLFIETDSFRQHGVGGRSPAPAPVTVTSPSPPHYHNYQGGYPYFSSLSPSPAPSPSPVPFRVTPSPRPTYSYPFPPIPTYPPTPAPYRRPTPAITFLDPPSPLLTPSPGSIEVRHRSFTPRPPVPTRAPPSDLQLQEQEERQPKEAAITFLDAEPEQEHLQEPEHEVELEAHLPALTLAGAAAADDVADNDDDDEHQEGNDDETYPPTVRTTVQEVNMDAVVAEEKVPQPLTVIGFDYHEEDELVATTAEPATAAPLPDYDISDNEVVTRATLGEVLDEIFSDPALPSGQRQDVPRSPQFFLPTPAPAPASEAPAPALTFEDAEQAAPGQLGGLLDEDEHAFHHHFLSSAEGEASLIEHMLRDEQDIANEEMLHHLHHQDHHQDTEQTGEGEAGLEGHPSHPEVPTIETEIQTNIIPQNSQQQEHKGRRVLKKRPIRIKIPATLRDNLQVIPESVSQEDELVLVVDEEAEQEFSFLQEPRQPKALSVFTDYDYDSGAEVETVQLTPEPSRDPAQQQQEAIPQNFSPLFAVPTTPTPAQVAEPEQPRSGAAQLQSAPVFNTAALNSPQINTQQLNTQQLNTQQLSSEQQQFAIVKTPTAAPRQQQSQPRPFRPILRQPSDYIFTPQAPAFPQQQFPGAPFQQQQQFRPAQIPQQQQFRPAEVPQQFRPAEVPQQQQQFSQVPQQQQFRPAEIPQQQQFRPAEVPRQQFRPTEAPQQQFRPEEIPQQQFRPAAIPQQQFRPTEIPPSPPQQQQSFTSFSNQGPSTPAPSLSFQEPVREQKAFPPPQTFNPNFLDRPSEDFNGNNNDNSFNTFSSFAPQAAAAGPPAGGNQEQSLFAMLNREVADRPVRTRLQESDPSIQKNIPKSSALDALLSIAGSDWDKNLHVSPVSTTTDDFACQGREGHFPDPGNCHVYHQCAGGTAHATTCPPGLAWNVVMNMCDWEDNVDCDINRGLKPIPTQDEILQQQQQQPQPPQQQPFSAFTAFLF